MPSDCKIVLRMHSGLGNQMFQYAFGLWLSHKTGYRLLLDTSFYLEYPVICNIPQEFQLDMFRIDYEVADILTLSALKNDRYTKIYTWLMRHIVRNGLLWKGPRHLISVGNSLKSIANLSFKDSLYLNGYWASDRYFNGIKDQVIKSFQIKEEYLQGIDHDLLHDIQRTESVALHIRRGIYLEIGYFHNLGLDYYQRAIAILREKIPNIKLFIFTDDHEWVKANIVFDIDMRITNENNPGHIDMYLMSLCKHNIIANSTFSWWGAYLNNNPHKFVLAPRLWTNDAAEQRKIEKNNILYPLDWIVT